MKKIYLAPAMQEETAQATQMLAESLNTRKNLRNMA